MRTRDVEIGQRVWRTETSRVTPHVRVHITGYIVARIHDVWNPRITLIRVRVGRAVETWHPAHWRSRRHGQSV